MLHLAIMQIAGVYLPLNTAYTPDECAFLLADAEPKLVIRDPSEVLKDALTLLSPSVSPVHRSANDPAAILYTSGTTGRPKGAILTHGNLTANASALVQAWGLTSSDVLLHALPIFHAHGLFVALHSALLAGLKTVWMPKFEAADVLDALPRATVLMGVPTFYTRLLEHPGLSRDVASNMRLFVCGSAPLRETTFQAFADRTGHRIVERYGLTEALIVCSNPLDGERLPGSVGYAMPSVAVRLDDAGVIQVRGPSVSPGYWNNTEATAQAFTADGFFITNDVARLDNDGRVWISGRSSDLIISGGYNVYPKEIELLLDDVEGVVESAVIGVPHPDFGEAVVAVITGDASEEVLSTLLRERVASYKRPKRYYFVESFPRTALGKIQKRALREIYQYVFIGQEAVG